MHHFRECLRFLTRASTNLIERLKFIEKVYFRRVFQTRPSKRQTPQNQASPSYSSYYTSHRHPTTYHHYLSPHHQISTKYPSPLYVLYDFRDCR